MDSIVTASVKLEPEIQEQVERLATAWKKPADWIVREAVREFLMRQHQREQFRLDTMASWEKYQATGLHVMQEEMEGWISRLEAGEDAPPPECHV